MEQHRIKLFPKQTLALDTILDEAVKEVLYGGAKGGGKSVLACVFAYHYAKHIIKICSLKPTKYPPVVGYMGRKRGVDFNDTTLETWKKMIPTENYVLRVQDKELLIDGTVKIQYGGFDDEKAVNKFNSAEFAFACIDQAEETNRDEIGLLRGALRCKLNGVWVPTKFLFTANPEECFLMDDFPVLPESERTEEIPSYRRFIQALPKDNREIDVEDYVGRLYEALKHRPELIKAYIEGEWSRASGARQIIKREWIEKAMDAKLIKPTLTKIVTANDPAWLGEDVDETVIYTVRDMEMVAHDYMYSKNTIEVAGKMIEQSKAKYSNLLVVDAIGIGAGVCDNVKNMTYKSVLPVISQKRAIGKTEEEEEINRTKYYNLRAQMWWTVGKLFAQGKVKIINDPELKKQLMSVQYEIRENGKIKVESKEDIKKKLGGRSPDRADAAVMAFFFCDYADAQMLVEEDEDDGPPEGFKSGRSY